ncbi:hypothetical protein ABK040_009276 [Willaertia magna]
MGISQSSGRELVEENDISTWDNQMVLNWLLNNGFGEYCKNFQNKVDGTILLTLTKDKLVDELQVPTGTAIKLMKYIEQVKKTQLSNTSSSQNNPSSPSPSKRKTSNTSTPINSPSLNNQLDVSTINNVIIDEEEYIKKCLIKLDKLKGLQNLSEKQKRDKAKNLVIKQHLLNSYLNKDYVATKKTIIELIDDSATTTKASSSDNNLDSNSTKNNQLVPHSTSEAAPILDLPPQVEIGEEDQKEEEDEKQQLRKMMKEFSETQENKQFSIKDEEFLKVKLVIVELHRTQAQRNFRRFLAPVLDTFDLVPQFGLFHSALIVGPWYLEWNDSSLIVPRKCYSGAAVLAADVERCFHGPQVGQALEKIGQVICDWNATMLYSQKKANCQHFVDELCRVLGIELKFKGALGEYCEKLRSNGSCKLNYYICKELKEKCGFEQDVIQFETHAQLDQFVKEILEKHSIYFDMSKSGQDDWLLLKSFDRAFWLRHFKTKKHDDFKPCESGCPFGDPSQSGSIIENFFTFKNKN